jgi:thiol:disulfide interchange protein
MQNVLQAYETRESRKVVAGLVKTIATNEGVGNARIMGSIVKQIVQTEEYATYARVTDEDEDEKQDALEELQKVIQSVVNEYRQPASNDDQSDADQSVVDGYRQFQPVSNDDQNDGDQKKRKIIRYTKNILYFLLSSGIFIVLPTLGIIILKVVKFASHFSKALRFGLGIPFVVPLAVVAYFFIVSIANSIKNISKVMRGGYSNYAGRQYNDGLRFRTTVIGEQDTGEQAVGVDPTY